MGARVQRTDGKGGIGLLIEDDRSTKPYLVRRCQHKRVAALHAPLPAILLGVPFYTLYSSFASLLWVFFSTHPPTAAAPAATRCHSQLPRPTAATSQSLPPLQAQFGSDTCWFQPSMLQLYEAHEEGAPSSTEAALPASQLLMLSPTFFEYLSDTKEVLRWLRAEQASGSQGPAGAAAGAAAAMKVDVAGPADSDASSVPSLNASKNSGAEGPSSAAQFHPLPLVISRMASVDRSEAAAGGGSAEPRAAAAGVASGGGSSASGGEESVAAGELGLATMLEEIAGGLDVCRSAKGVEEGWKRWRCTGAGWRVFWMRGGRNRGDGCEDR